MATMPSTHAADLSTDPVVSEIGVVRHYVTDAPCRVLSVGEHRRGLRQERPVGVPSLLGHCPGVASGVVLFRTSCSRPQTAIARSLARVRVGARGCWQDNDGPTTSDGPARDARATIIPTAEPPNRLAAYSGNSTMSRSSHRCSPAKISWANLNVGTSSLRRRPLNFDRTRRRACLQNKSASLTARAPAARSFV